MSNNLTVVLPTRNEAGNVGPLIHALREALDPATVIVVDGQSTDETCNEAESEGAEVLTNTESYASSLLQGLRSSTTEWTLVMDADGSHRAKDARWLWNAREGFDLVIGSRFAGDGGSDAPPTRTGLSWLLGFMFRVFGRLPAHDVSSGFRLYRTAMFREFAPRAQHFEIQTELLWLAKLAGARVHEVGIHYHDRDHGVSKIRVFEFGRAFLHLFARVTRG